MSILSPTSPSPTHPIKAAGVPSRLRVVDQDGVVSAPPQPRPVATLFKNWTLAGGQKLCLVERDWDPREVAGCRLCPGRPCDAIPVDGGVVRCHRIVENLWVDLDGAKSFVTPPPA